MVRYWWLILLLLPGVVAEQCIDGKCYECDGYLTNIDNEIKCIKCAEGFVFKDNQCITEYEIMQDSPGIIDKFIYKFFPENQKIGVLLLVILAVAMFYIIKNRKEIKHFVTR